MEQDKTQPSQANPNTGLTKEQVAQRAEAGQVNVAVEAPTKTVSQIILTNTFTYFNFVFALLALLLILVGSFRELTFLPIIIANTLIGIIQEIRSKKCLINCRYSMRRKRASCATEKKQSSIPSS